MSDMQAAEQAIVNQKVDDFLEAKPSQKILMALEDLEAIEKRENYQIDMNAWMEWLYVTKINSTARLAKGTISQHQCMEICFVCFAGAVMANRFNTNHWEMRPLKLHGASNLHTALDQFRRGNIHRGLDYLNIPFPPNLPSVLPVCPYSHDRDRFKKDMQALAKILEQRSL